MQIPSQVIANSLNQVQSMGSEYLDSARVYVETNLPEIAEKMNDFSNANIAFIGATSLASIALLTKAVCCGSKNSTTAKIANVAFAGFFLVLAASEGYAVINN